MATQHHPPTVAAVTLSGANDWRRRPPVLETRRLIVREVAPGDAAALTLRLADPEVWRFIDPPPSSVAGFRRFIAWSRRERRAGRYLSMAVTLRDGAQPAGIIQVWPLDPPFSVAEWGFVFGRAFWGQGLFREAASAFIDFIFDGIGARRLEARAAVGNLRGLAALRSLGSVDEGVLRKCFMCRNEPSDHVLSAILATEWRERRAGYRRVQ